MESYCFNAYKISVKGDEKSVEKDSGKAEMWLRKAIKFGLEEAKPILQKVLEKKSNAGSQSK